MRIAGYLAVLFFMLGAVVQLLIQLPDLPDPVASHFDAIGAPDGFMPKRTHIKFMLGVQVGLPLLLAILAAGLRYLPDSMLNIPHKEYWLHADRRAQTLRDSQTTLLCITVATSMFLIGLSHLIFLANVQGGGLPKLWFLLLLAAFLIVVLGLAAKSVLHYRRVPPPSDA